MVLAPVTVTAAPGAAINIAAVTTAKVDDSSISKNPMFGRIDRRASRLPLASLSKAPDRRTAAHQRANEFAKLIVWGFPRVRMVLAYFAVLVVEDGDSRALLGAWRGGDRAARDRLFTLFYFDLRRSAATLLRRERGALACVQGRP